MNRLRFVLAFVLLLVLVSRAAGQESIPNYCGSCGGTRLRQVWIVQDSGRFDGVYCSKCASANLKCEKCRSSIFRRERTGQGTDRDDKGNEFNVSGTFGRTPSGETKLCTRCLDRANAPPPAPTARPEAPDAPDVLEPGSDTPPARSHAPAPAARSGRTWSAFFKIGFGVAMFIIVAVMKVVIARSGEAPETNARAILPASELKPAARPTKKRHDETYGDADALRLIEQAQSGSGAEVLEKLAATTDFDDREFLVHAVGNALAGGALPTAPAGKKNLEAAAALLAGRALITQAWEARGGGVAASVSDDGFRRFFELLGKAERELQRAAQLAPEDPTPHALLVTVARGLQHPKEVARERFTAAATRYPEHHHAHQHLMIALAAKWSGSHEEMFAFAREASAKAPEGSLVHSVIAAAHIERWLYATGFAESAEEDPWYKRGDEYWQDATVVDEILAAHRRSLGTIGFRKRKNELFARNQFAFCFHLMKRKDLARRELEVLGARMTETPWGFRGVPATRFAEARRDAGLPALG